jgi:tol-pal system protein YbgF
MTNRIISTIFFFSLLFACAPQAELVKLRNEMNDLRADTKTRAPELSSIEKRIDVLDANVKGTADLQKAVADYGVRFDQLTTDLQILQGKLEENNFRIAELAQKLDDKTFKIAELSAKVDELEAKVKAPSGGAPAPATGGEKKAEAKAPSPTEAYQQAKTDYDKGNFDLAIDGFRNYVKQFPDSSRADSAQYWIGECYYSKKEYAKAIDEFNKVLKNYPKSDKVAGARLKIGFSYLNEKNTAKAKEHLNKVIKDFPHTKEAELAKERLSRIGK